MNDILDDVLSFLDENGAASMVDLVEALECKREEISEALRSEGRLDERLTYSKQTSMYSLR